MKDFVASEKLNECSIDSFMNIVYSKNGLSIFSMPNWSNENILCFWVTKDISDDEFEFCRLSMMEPKYINAENESLKLSKNEIDEIIHALSTNDTGTLGWNDDCIFPRNWDFMIAQLNDDHKSTYPNEKLVWKDIPLDLPIPDYRLLLKEDIKNERSKSGDDSSIKK